MKKIALLKKKVLQLFFNQNKSYIFAVRFEKHKTLIIY